MGNGGRTTITSLTTEKVNNTLLTVSIDTNDIITLRGKCGQGYSISAAEWAKLVRRVKVAWHKNAAVNTHCNRGE